MSSKTAWECETVSIEMEEYSEPSSDLKFLQTLEEFPMKKEIGFTKKIFYKAWTEKKTLQNPQDFTVKLSCFKYKKSYLFLARWTFIV